MKVNTDEIIRDEDINCGIDEYNYEFKENFTKVENESDTWLYIDNGNLSNEVSYEIKPRQKGKVIEAILTSKKTEWTKSELVGMETETVYEHYKNAFYWELGDFIENAEKNGIKLEREDYVEYELSGYSQGDAVVCIVNRSEAFKVWGNTVEKGTSQESLHQLFFDSPQTVRITILGTEYISDQFDSYYDNYDKDEFIAELVDFFKDEVENLEFFEEQLEDLLPYELDYK